MLNTCRIGGTFGQKSHLSTKGDESVPFPHSILIRHLGRRKLACNTTPYYSYTTPLHYFQASKNSLRIPARAHDPTSLDTNAQHHDTHNLLSLVYN